MTITNMTIVTTIPIISPTMYIGNESAEGDESVGTTESPAGAKYINSPTVTGDSMPTLT